VFPGATHTRFIHSLGVFHVARQLMSLIERHVSTSGGQYKDHQALVALAAALVHDVGHGMFSHAFEKVGKALGLPMAHHELVTERLIRESEIADELAKELGAGFPNEVASVIKAGKPGNLYDAVVSSQFDADRLDYLRRDRMMTGVESSGIDATWLSVNLEIASVRTGADTDAAGSVETLVLGPKSFYVAENYVLSLFQLYPNVYFHKATKAAECVFSALMLRIGELARDGSGDKAGLPSRHPIRRFFSDPNNLSNVLALDDTVFWGALPMMAEAGDATVSAYAKQLINRRLPKCIDVRQWFEQKIPLPHDAERQERAERAATISVHCNNVVAGVEEARQSPSTCPVFVDQDRRSPYKKFQDSQSLLNQILIRSGTEYADMAELSPVVASAENFEVCRVYITEGDTGARSMVENIMGTELRGEG
jgi:HD superfamily phosphohydrolase